ncbi:MAG: hypothetical protein IPL23_17505 [Saprospiraceae bacterium]|nr:hypothetical protein [Saprospiraceae bacterium]MBP7643230.1 hypothetical protein [Saprospiraceae bacterium]
MSRKLYILFYIMTFWATCAMAQTKSQYVEAGEKALVEKNYYGALVYFNEVLDFDANDINALKKSGDAARQFNSYQLAIQRYEYLLDTLNYNEDKMLYFYLGEMHQRIGNYGKAGDYYNMYLSQFSDDADYFTQKARVEKVAVDWANLKMNDVDPNVTLERLETEVNSPDSEFGAMVKDSNLIFSSMRFKETKSKLNPPRQISKIMQDKDGIIGVFDEALNDTDLSLGNTAMNLDKTVIYFTKCTYVEPHKLRCDLYKGNLGADEKVTNIQMLPATINDTTHTTTQPAIGKFGNDDREVLFFSSDRVGGKGKLDIWYSFINGDSLSAPINLAAINTSEEEITPFFHTPSKNLYFSSDGKQGFGGFDIYHASFNNDSIIDIYHMDAPYNSSYHDIYFTLSDDFTKGYMSSNREGALYVDEMLKSCCFDIYALDIKPLEITLKALTFNKRTGEDLHGAKVSLYDVATGELLAEMIHDTSNVYLFPIERGKQYMVKAEKIGFKSDSITFSTADIKESGEIVKKLFLEPDLLNLDVFTFDADTREALAGATIAIEDLTDPTKPQVFKFNELSNDFHFQLERGKTYRITAKKDGYATVSELIDTKGLENNLRKDLYLKKLGLSAYVPLSLYFDNDQPEPDKKTTETNKNYSTLYNAYNARKKTFITRNGDAKATNEFFGNEMKEGVDKLNLFMEDLLVTLDSGQKIEMTIKGFASPRFDVKYNLVLAQRRIMSVINEMKSYKGGRLAAYLNSNSLVINQVSFGEELAPVDVDDKLRNEKESIYSIKASKERKVEVISVKAKL